MWPKASDGKVYIPYVIANHYCKYLNVPLLTPFQGYVAFSTYGEVCKVHVKGELVLPTENTAPEMSETPWQLSSLYFWNFVTT